MDHIILTSSSPADFISKPLTISSSIVNTIAQSPTHPNPRKKSADPTVRKLHLESKLTSLPLSPTQTEPEVVDQFDTTDSTQKEMTQPDISIFPSTSGFGHSYVVLSSDSQESINLFHTATHSLMQSPQTDNPPPQQPIDTEHHGNRARRSLLDSKIKPRHQLDLFPLSFRSSKQNGD